MRNRLITIGVIIIVSAVLAFVLGDFIHHNIILPIANILNKFIWVVQLFIESIDQVIFWISFLIIALLIASGSLFNPAKVSHPPGKSALIHKSRFAIWQERIKNLHRGDYFKWRLAKNLGGLALEAIAFRQGITVDQALIHLKEKQLDVPDEICAYIIAGQRSSPFKEDTLSVRGRKSRNSLLPLELDPGILLDFLDTQLGNETPE